MSAIESLLRERLAFLSPLKIELIDDSAEHAGHAGAREGGHYRLLIVSRRFRGQRAVARHRLVYQALEDMMQRQIHALAISAYTPDELDSAFPGQ